MLKICISSVLMLLLVSCSSLPEKTRWNEVAMRVMVDPDSIPESQYVVLISSLMQSGRWSVIDRARGWEAVKQEQERTHVSEPERYDSRYKWAMWGKMYGVGGVIVANVQCEEQRTWFLNRRYLVCAQALSLVDASTGEIITTSYDRVEGETELVYVPPSWDKAVNKLALSFPKDYRLRKHDESIKEYIKHAEENAGEYKRSLASDPSLSKESLE